MTTATTTMTTEERGNKLPIEKEYEQESEDDEEPFVPAPLSWFPPTSEPSTNDAAVCTEEESTDAARFNDADLPEVVSPEVEPPIVADVGGNNGGGASTTSSILSQYQRHSISAPLASPSWQEISSQVLPKAARELLTASFQRVCYTAQWTYAQGRWTRKYSDFGNSAGGYDRHALMSQDSSAMLSLDEQSLWSEKLPPISSLPWVDRQLVKEWRTTAWGAADESMHGSTFSSQDDPVNDDDDGDFPDDDFDRARALVPMPIQRPPWRKADACHACRKPFGPTRLRHHCRLCGNSYCQPHSSYAHRLPHLGYDPDVPERVCDACKHVLLEQALAERVAWRLARCRDYELDALMPYFETGIDTLEMAAQRIAQAAIAMAKSVPLGAQATVAVETVDVLRRYGLNGIYTIMLRQEFLAAADLLRKALGINRTAWPLSVHELSAAIFYALAQHRAMRGISPDREHMLHALRGAPPSQRGRTAAMDAGVPDSAMSPLPLREDTATDPTSLVGCSMEDEPQHDNPVCDPVPESMLVSLIFYAPMALKFIYADKEVDMQLLAAQQGWRLLYAYLQQEASRQKNSDRPASALFVHHEQKIACVAVRGTTTIHDMVTDIRQTPVPFPESDPDVSDTDKGSEGDWTKVFRGQGLAVCGMASAAVNLYYEHVDALLFLAKRGYRIRTTGHSLGGGVATLLAVLLHRALRRIPELAKKLSKQDGVALSINVPESEAILRVYSYGTPSCVDADLADFVQGFVVSVVQHDDVIPRLTPASCRGLLKHLLHIRETWVKDHFTSDLMAITARAKTAWAPRWREGFTLPVASSRTIQRYCKKQYQKGKRKLQIVKDKMMRDGDVPSKNVCEESSFGGVTAHVPSSHGTVDVEPSPLASNPFAGEADLLVDVLGAMNVKDGVKGLVVDGDEFFDPEESLVESDDASAASSDVLNEAAPLQTRDALSTDGEKSSGNNESDTFEAQVAVTSDESPGAVMLEEAQLPRMYIPGKIVHIYSHRGTYKAALVPRGFREIRRISLAGNMLTDHKCTTYYEALVEVRTVKAATEHPPRWTAFDEDDTCSCCASRFTWASTSNSEAQAARDKHNCRSCGTLVCDPCSGNRVPLPSIGLHVPVRACDRCYYDVLGLVDAVNADVVARETSRSEQPRTKAERKRDRRSAVVDHLVSQVQSKSLTSCST